MAQASFGFYVDSGEEKLARIYSKIYMPLNITLDEGSDLNLSEREPCEVDIWSNEYEELGIYSLEEWGDPNAASNPPRRLIPCGTFAANFAEDSNWEENFKQNGTIIFTGSVIEAERINNPKEGDPKWKLLVESFKLSFWLYYYGDSPIEPGYIVNGVAWLHGKLKRAGPKQPD